MDHLDTYWKSFPKSQVYRLNISNLFLSHEFIKNGGKSSGNLVAKEEIASKNKANWRQCREETLGRSGNKIQGLAQG
ncbi:hypothetical protein SanaruYs_29690 [Chryseotalea sanaruensis]|uniref:Uncharacterized protein n=1 Tax=Chryseotalea sanaruensis TaxID=2482724 RepID=A0A401UCT5_9BACT|nr:hypothetical protein SanaruYs_29690 [Chryseotalea sanaruensis]